MGNRCRPPAFAPVTSLAAFVTTIFPLLEGQGMKFKADHGAAFAKMNSLLRRSIDHWDELDYCLILMALGAMHRNRS